MSDYKNLPPVTGGVPVWYEDNAIRIDVRGLEPPGPLVAIIELIEREGTGDVVIAKLHRDPVFLYPELSERGWNWEKLSVAKGNVLLRLVKDSTA